jgi:GIY-YIG catalytic domain.
MKKGINLNDILSLSENEISNSKIEFNMKAGNAGEHFLDRWLKCSDSDKENGTCKECSFWGWYGKSRNFHKNQWVFSFLRMDENDKWLLVSVAKIIDIPKDSFASFQVLDRFSPFFGRLIVKCKKGDKFSRHVFNLSKYLETITVKEILPCLYSGEQFNGYDRVNLEYKKLNDVFSGKIMPTYYEALKTIAGVYCLTDTFTGKLYIGSATGRDGVAQRWGNYIATKHGGNKKLTELYNAQGAKYFEKYFTFTILEYFGLSYDTNKIIEREQYWKKCLNTISHGYNDN